MLIAALVLLALASVPLTGGRLSALAEVQVRGGWIAVLALAVQVLIVTIFPGGDHALHTALHLGTYALLGAFVWVNRRIPGLLVIGAGGALNLVAIAANGGVMPASVGALRRAGLSPDPGQFTNSGALAHPRLLPLGDVFATPAGHAAAQRLQRGGRAHRAGRPVPGAPPGPGEPPGAHLSRRGRAQPARPGGRRPRVRPGQSRDRRRPRRPPLRSAAPVALRPPGLTPGCRASRFLGSWPTPRGRAGRWSSATARASSPRRAEAPHRPAGPAWVRDHGGMAAFRIMGVVNVTPDSFSDGGAVRRPRRRRRARPPAGRRGRGHPRRRRGVHPARRRAGAARGGAARGSCP